MTACAIKFLLRRIPRIIVLKCSRGQRIDLHAWNPEGDWTSRHQMSVNGKRIGIEDADVTFVVP